jgi:hypothetical protein
VGRGIKAVEGRLSFCQVNAILDSIGNDSEAWSVFAALMSFEGIDNFPSNLSLSGQRLVGEGVVEEGNNTIFLFIDVSEKVTRQSGDTF